MGERPVVDKKKEGPEGEGPVVDMLGRGDM